MIKYGLYHIEKKALLAVHAFPPKDSIYLSYDDGDENRGIWTATSKAHAEWVRYSNTASYNSTNKTPNHSYKAEDLQVVEIVTTINEVKNIPITTELDWSIYRLYRLDVVYEEKYLHDIANIVKYIKRILEKGDSKIPCKCYWDLLGYDKFKNSDEYSKFLEWKSKQTFVEGI